MPSVCIHSVCTNSSRFVCGDFGRRAHRCGFSFSSVFKFLYLHRTIPSNHNNKEKNIIPLAYYNAPNNDKQADNGRMKKTNSGGNISINDNVEKIGRNRSIRRRRQSVPSWHNSGCDSGGITLVSFSGHYVMYKGVWSERTIRFDSTLTQFLPKSLYTLADYIYFVGVWGGGEET